jgi:hypothetical protein
MNTFLRKNVVDSTTYNRYGIATVDYESVDYDTDVAAGDIDEIVGDEIVGGIVLAIGVILVGIGIWLLVFALVTLEKLIVRVGEFINMFKNMSDSLNN